MNTINWGIISTGAIAKAFARGLKSALLGTAYAVASREIDKAKAFASEFGFEKSYGSYEALLADPDVHAVYISVPHQHHVEWALKAAKAKKHILVEKPFALNAADAMAVFETAKANNVLAMEAFMYRCHPQTSKLVELLKEKVIGEVRIINATFSFHAGFNPTSRLFANDYGGGGILDVGCYTMSIARLIAGAALGKDFANPVEVSGCAHLGQTGVDEWAIAALKFENGILAQLSTGIAVNQENIVRIFGSEGRITLPIPYHANRVAGEDGRIIIHRNGEKEPREITVASSITAFAQEADTFARAVLDGQLAATPPAMTPADTLGNLRALDRWRDAIRLTYDQEKSANYRTTTVHGISLARSANAIMPYAKIANLDQPVSRLIMGCDNQRTFPHAAVLFDDFFERGGNTFDTAFVYGGGLQENLLGQWVKHRGVRDQINLIVKGCHTPFDFPRDIASQLRVSLDRLQTDHADIYILHRDNPDVPVSEWVDALNQQVKAGRIKTFGGSNWTPPRVQEANDYAAKHGLQGFSVVSNNFSLATMNKPIWAGCISSNDPQSRAWFTKSQVALLAWSSQARGFFVPGVAEKGKPASREMQEIYCSDDNFERQKRAFELARELNVAPINIALAFVLHQPFPTFALIGPRTLEETRTSMDGLKVKLTEAQVKWLNLER